MKTKTTIESKVREIKRATRRKFSAEEKIRIVLEVLRAEDSLATICRREGIENTFPIKDVTSSFYSTIRTDKLIADFLYNIMSTNKIDRIQSICGNGTSPL